MSGIKLAGKLILEPGGLLQHPEHLAGSAPAKVGILEARGVLKPPKPPTRSVPGYTARLPQSATTRYPHSLSWSERSSFITTTYSFSIMVAELLPSRGAGEQQHHYA